MWDVTRKNKAPGLIAVTVTRQAGHPSAEQAAPGGASVAAAGDRAGPFAFDASVVRGVPFAPWLKAERLEAVDAAVKLRSSDVLVATFPKSGTTLAEQAILAFQSGAHLRDRGSGGSASPRCSAPALAAGDKNALGRRWVDPAAAAAASAASAGDGSRGGGCSGGLAHPPLPPLPRVWAKVWPEACMCIPEDDDGSGERQRGAEFSPLSTAAFDALPSPRLVKSHAPPGLVPGLAAALRTSAGSEAEAVRPPRLPRVVVVTREPKDVATSAFYHAWSPAKSGWPFGAWAAAWAAGATPSGRWGDWHRAWREYAEAGEGSGGSGGGRDGDGGGGGGNSRWRPSAGRRVLVLRFEDLASRDDATRLTALTALGRFVLAPDHDADHDAGAESAAGADADDGAAAAFDALVGRVDALCRFDAMKAAASSCGKGGHLRKGSSGDWRAHFDEADKVAVDAACGEEAALLGYREDDDKDDAAAAADAAAIDAPQSELVQPRAASAAATDATTDAAAARVNAAASKKTAHVAAVSAPGTLVNKEERTLAELGAEAEVLHPLLAAAHTLWEAHALSDADLVGVFIIAVCALRRPRAWLGGRLLNGPMAPAANANANANAAAGVSADAADSRSAGAAAAAATPAGAVSSVRLSAVPGLALVAGGGQYLAAKTGEEDPTVFHVFNVASLAGIRKNVDSYINRCLALWFAGKRPCALLFRIPTPMEVLRMQAAGTRVVTLFLKKEELAKRHVARLVYLPGDASISKDPLEFTLHDLKHMEHFVDPQTFEEQVGLFRCLLSLGAPATSGAVSAGASTSEAPSAGAASSGHGVVAGGPRRFFLTTFGLDLDFWHQAEYVISDMNGFSTFILHFLLVKVLFAVERLRASDSSGFGPEAAAAATKGSGFFRGPSCFPDVGSHMGAVWAAMLDCWGVATGSEAASGLEAMLARVLASSSERGHAKKGPAEASTGSPRAWGTGGGGGGSAKDDGSDAARSEGGGGGGSSGASDQQAAAQAGLGAVRAFFRAKAVAELGLDASVLQGRAFENRYKKHWAKVAAAEAEAAEAEAAKAEAAEAEAEAEAESAAEAD